ncbi:rhodanese-like domain-containing protein [Aureivirga sp. CE67]|uniref:rhodanese-like domain-containing protein n=1 Tax=Aureivirga sp. CE67 TaxID=1788983 RepID=UPI0018CA6C7C|nr:rhodanese-like domain-containing protein [Aureivirga sp. CE67]
MKHFYILILLFFTAFFVEAQNTKLDRFLNKELKKSVPLMTVEELYQMTDSVLLVDARSFKEFRVSHIEGAHFVDYDTFTKEDLPLDLQKNTKIVVYCSLGIRSEHIGEKIMALGFKNVYNLKGGIFEWSNFEYPVVNSKNEDTDEIHTFSKEWSTWLLKGIKIYEH